MSSTGHKHCRAVFLDRDGVLVEDIGLLVQADDFKLLPGVAEGLRRLHLAGFKLIVVTNQTVVARGMLEEKVLQSLHETMQELLQKAGAPQLDGIYYCPHHPKATLPQWRSDCDCRKPKPGLLLQAAVEHDIDLSSSYVVGDRITDILAGAKAGCKTVQVQTGKHLEAPIETSKPLETGIKPDFVCRDLLEAAQWIIQSR